MTPTFAGLFPCPSGQKGDPEVVFVLIFTPESVSHLRAYLTTDIRSPQARVTVWKTIQEVRRRFPDGMLLLDPVQNMHITDNKFTQLVKKIAITELNSIPLHQDARLPELYTLSKQKVKVSDRCRELKKKILATHDVCR
ncbi:rRNA-processing arch domain-containing protein [Phanerochaete sordida]|uniref:rRNA-processing arch domain-containing protein n=1 Tax=Phanerochaete sordida TaxID=48140 RepID=A0A9P3GQ18_9APHY|nr:rRNA-processing arch domain-containing protein [Phanerochaete sordida]